jgi:hypothetical protein
MRTPTITHGGDFTCRHCGALYVVSNIELPIADSGSAFCEVCRRQMIQWNSILQPSYRLVRRPDPTVASYSPLFASDPAHSVAPPSPVRSRTISPLPRASRLPFLSVPLARQVVRGRHYTTIGPAAY